ncbi:MAG: TonB-dependent receptor, partial [Gluconobacter japonicus]
MLPFVSARSFLVLLGCTTALCGAAHAQDATAGTTTAETETSRSSFGHSDNQHGTTVTETSRTGEDDIVVNAHLERARDALQSSTGATTYRFSRQDIETNPGGDNAPLTSVLLQAPGVAQDSYGQIHIRGDHNEVQFRLDGVALPEGMSVFGQALMTRFAHSM